MFYSRPLPSGAYLSFCSIYIYIYKVTRLPYGRLEEDREDRELWQYYEKVYLSYLSQ